MSVGHPQTNGKEKVTNRTILPGLMAYIRRTKQAWVNELDNVLWAYRTTHRVPIVETAFSLAYGTEAVLSLEVSLPSPRIDNIDLSIHEEQL